MSQRLSLPQAFVFLLRRDLLLALRNRAEYAMPLLFFVLVITLFLPFFYNSGVASICS